MKVCNINAPIFRSNIKGLDNSTNVGEHPQIKSLPATTPDYHVRVPMSYSKIGVITLNNGLEIHQYKLKNGHTITIIPMEDSPTVVKNYVNVGSMNETENIKGISHFLEHMAFNGTNGENGHIKLEVGDSFKKIDELGGWANASTNYAITDYVNSAPQLKESDLKTQIEVIGAMTEDLMLSNAMIEKEKGPVCSEINMILDNPQTIALDQTVRSLFSIKNPADELVGGSVKHIKNLTRKDVVDYYNKYYTPDNMNLVITGNVEPEEAIKLVSKTFNSTKKSTGKKYEESLNPIQNTIRKDFISDKATSAEIVIGFAGADNTDTKGKILTEILIEYLYSQSFGLENILNKDNVSLFADYDKISTNPKAPQLIYIGTSCADDKSEKTLGTIFRKLGNHKKINEETLANIKETLIDRYTNAGEYSSLMNNIVGKLILDNDLKFLTEYENIINSITPEDVNEAFEKYINVDKAAVTVVHPQKNGDISFKAKKREPVNCNKISEYKTKNNYDIGFYETKNNKIRIHLGLKSDIPYNKTAAAVPVLHYMYKMGSENMSKEEFDEFLEKNNIDIDLNFTDGGISIYGSCKNDKKDLMYQAIEEMLYQPRLTEENFELAKEQLKDTILRMTKNANNLYENYSAQNNPYDFSIQEIQNSIDAITLDDVKECHKYTLNNSRGMISANLPDENKEEIKNRTLAFALSLNKVLENKKVTPNIYKPNTSVKILTEENNNSQADIKQVHNFKLSNSIKEKAALRILNSILTSSSIGLFDILREKEHLAYSVHSELDQHMDTGEISCNILTTTDNKAIGEFSYDNVQKSINGFNRQIDELKNGNFTDKDLENAKLSLKAGLLDSEGTFTKLLNIYTGLNSEYGIKYLNKIYTEIDNITKEDIMEVAQKVFENPPIYSVVASKDTLKYNENFFKTLENKNSVNN